MNKAEAIITTKLWGTKDTADYLGVPVNTLYQWRAKGYGPPAHRIGKYIKYVPGEVRNWVNRQPETVL
jgi:predicted DNA-binding transcriptional regulator AlpA